MIGIKRTTERQTGANLLRLGGLLPPYRRSSAIDPQYSKVSLLLRQDSIPPSATLDYSGNALTVTQVNGPLASITASNFGGPTFLFNGSNQYLSLVGNSVFDFADQDFTIEAFVYFNSVSGVGNIWSQRASNTGGATGVTFRVSSGKLSFFHSQGVDGITGSGTVTTGTWYHVALTREDTYFKLWLNGALDGTSVSTTFSLPPNIAVNIGRALFGQEYFSGYIESVRVTKGVARYRTAFAPPTAPFPRTGSVTIPSPLNNVSLLLPMDGSNLSTTFVDSSLSNHVISVNGDASMSTEQSKFGGVSAKFDGSGDWLSIADNAAFQFGTGDFTIEGWFYTASQAQNYSCILASGASPYGNNSIFLVNYGTGTVAGVTRKLSFGVNVSGTPKGVNSTTLIAVNTWYHFAVTRLAGTVYLLLNGTLEGSLSITDSINLSASGLQIGRNGWDGATSHWNGYIDDLRITKGVARYTASFIPPAAPYAGGAAFDPGFGNVSLLLPMDGTAGTATFTDASNNDLAVTVGGGAKLNATVSKFGGVSAKFDGSNDYLTVSDSSLAFGTGDFSVELWVYRAGNAGVGSIYSQSLLDARSSDSSTDHHLYINGSGTNYPIVYNVGGTDRITGSTIGLNTWYFVQLIRSSGVTKLYLNGTQTGSSYTDVNDYASTTWRIAGRYAAVSSDYRSLNGYIDDFRATKGLARPVATAGTMVSAFPSVQDPDAAAYIGRIEVADRAALEPKVRQAIDAFILGCKADGTWASIKASCILAGARTLEGALTPLAGTAPTNAGFASADYNRKTGLKGDGTSKYLNSNRANNVDAQNNRHMAVYMTSGVTGGAVRVLIGAESAATSGTSLLYNEPTASNEMRAALSINVTPTPSGFGSNTGTVSGFAGISRSADGSFTGCLSGAVTTFTGASQAPSSGNLAVFARTPASPDRFADCRMAFYSLGSDIALVSLRTRIEVLISAFGTAIA